MLGRLKERFGHELKLSPMSSPYSHKHETRFWTLMCLIAFAVMLAAFAAEVFLEVRHGVTPVSVRHFFF